MNTTEIIERLRMALEARNYNAFVDMFAEDAVFEVPFGLEANPKRYAGIEKIREHFNAIAERPFTKLIELHKVHALQHQSTEPGVVTVEYTIAGKSIATGKLFKVPSSFAIVYCNNGKVIHYKDFPNTIGLAQVANVLPQLAASLTG
jgi:ketosteroid isomerase-like protein